MSLPDRQSGFEFREIKEQSIKMNVQHCIIFAALLFQITKSLKGFNILARGEIPKE